MAESNNSGLALNNSNNGERNCENSSQEDHPENSGQQGKPVDIMEPLLIEDYTIANEPKTLTDLYQYLKKEGIPVQSTNIFIGLVYIIMLESGFVPSGPQNGGDAENFQFNYKRVLHFSKNITQPWGRGQNKFIFKLPPFQYEIQLVCIEVPGDVLINCAVKNLNVSYNIILDPASYIVKSVTNSSGYILQYVRALAQTVKDDIAFPIKCALCQHAGVLKGLACLDNLPPELLMMIMEKLDQRSLDRLAECSSRLKCVVLEVRAKKRVK